MNNSIRNDNLFFSKTANIKRILHEKKYLTIIHVKTNTWIAFDYAYPYLVGWTEDSLFNSWFTVFGSDIYLAAGQW